MNARCAAATALAAALLTACGANQAQNAFLPGRGFGPAARDARAGRQNKSVEARARFVIPRPHRHGVKPRFVSGATNGAEIVATGAGQRYTTVVDLSPSSNNCATHGGTRTCRVNAQVPVGSDRIDVKTYDTAPVSGKIPAGAHILGIGSSKQTVVSGVTPYIVVFLGGVIGSIGAGPANSSLAADGAQHTATFVVDPTDFGNQPIVAGHNDPYHNPIGVTLAESGGNGHSVLSFNGNPSGTSATMKFSSDTIALQYDGGGSRGYSVSVAFKASGVAAQSLQVSPLFVSGKPIVSRVLGLSGTPSNPTLTITEANAPAGTTYTVTPAGCTQIATSSGVSGSGATATFSVAGGTQASATGCTLAIADSFSTTYTLPVTNTPVTGGATVNGVQLTEYGVGGETFGITNGPDGNLWFTEQSASEVGVIDPATQTLVNSFAIPGSFLAQLATGSDGAVWVADQNLEGVDRVTTTGIVVPYAFPNGGQPFGAIAVPDGTLWFSDCSSTLWHVTIGGGATQPPIGLSGNSPQGLVDGPDGAIWFAENDYIGRYDPIALTLSETPVPNGGSAQGIAVGADGNIWFTAQDFGPGLPFIGRMTPGSPCPCAVTTFNLSASAVPYGIAGGIDDAMWFVDRGDNAIGRITTTASHAITSYTIPTANAGPEQIAVGPDGSLWFTETLQSNIGHIVP